MNKKTVLIIAIVLTLIGVRVSFFGEHTLYDIYTSYTENRVHDLTSDMAGIFTDEQTDSLNTYHSALLKDYDIDLRVKTIADDSDINIAAHSAFQDMNAGSLSTSGRGLLLLINTRTDEVRLEVSNGLEPVYTDAFTSYIQHRQMIPFFKNDQVARGILATTEMIVTRAQDAVKGQEFMPPMESRSSGGGAANPADIGRGEDLTYKQKPVQPVPEESGLTPQDVLYRYLQKLENRNANPNWPLYTAATQDMMQSWTVTPGQMDNEARSLRKCGPGQLIIEDDLRHAVVRHGYQDRHCTPYFFKKEDGGWKLDLSLMGNTVRFNNKNQWRFDLSKAHDYGFAFTDWAFDKNGYPIRQYQKGYSGKFRWGYFLSQCDNKTTICFRNVMPGSAAAVNGLRDWDRLIAVNGTPIRKNADFTDVMKSAKPGEEIEILLNRDKKRMKITVTAPDYL